MSVRCNTCGEPFENYKDLAVHISISGKSHKKGKMWAARFVTNVNYLDQKKDRVERSPVDDQVRKNREECVRETFNRMTVTKVSCPSCHKLSRMPLEIEHVENPLAWRSGNSMMIICDTCRTKHKIGY